MNTVDIIREQARMCTESHCYQCGLSKGANCRFFRRDHPTEAVKIVEQWAKEHPAKTYKSALLEKFPNAKLGKNGVPMVCVNDVFKGDCEDATCHVCGCYDCWNCKYEEGDLK